MVEKGYKLTEVGAIPIDWELNSIDELIDLLTDFDSNGSFASVAENVKVYDYEEFAWYVRSTDLENRTKMNEVRYVDKASYDFLKKTSLFGGELLFLKRGDIGRVYLFKKQSNFATVAPNLYLLKINSRTRPEYLYYFFNTQLGQNQLKSKNASSTLGALYKDDVKSIIVPLPTLHEQAAIAEALSDMDAQIAQTEKLIEKKKAIKKGMMQELFTPKEGWVTKKLEDLCVIIKSGGTPLTSNPNFYNGEIPFLSIGDMTSQGKYLKYTTSTISREGLESSASWIVPKNSIIYSMYASVGYVSITKVELAISQAVLCMIFKSSLNLSYMYYYLLSIQTKVLMYVGEGTQKNLNAATVKQFDVYLPSLTEQLQIAEILNDQDNEISLLETKLQKLKYQKQGMMQALLIGKIRLI